MTITRSSLLLKLTTGTDPESWREFIRIYRPLIEQTARRKGVPACDQDDVVQDVLIQLLRSLGTFQKRRGRFRGWLRRVTINKIVDVRRKRSATVPLRCDPAESFSEHAEQDLWDREFRSRLMACALAHVRRRSQPQTWRCFEEHALKRRTAADVARDLSLSENAVYVNCSRIMSRVRGYCSRHGEELPNVAVPLPE